VHPNLITDPGHLRVHLPVQVQQFGPDRGRKPLSTAPFVYQKVLEQAIDQRFVRPAKRQAIRDMRKALQKQCGPPIAWELVHPPHGERQWRAIFWALRSAQGAWLDVHRGRLAGFCPFYGCKPGSRGPISEDFEKYEVMHIESLSLCDGYTVL
jgi:hypothetical protein